MAELRTDYLADLGASYGRGLGLASQINARKEDQMLRAAKMNEMRMAREQEAQAAQAKAKADQARLLVGIADAASKIHKIAGKEGLSTFSQALGGIPGTEWMKNANPDDFEFKEGETLYHVKDPDGNYVGSLAVMGDKVYQFKSSTPSKSKPAYRKFKGEKIDLGGKSFKAPPGHEMELTVNDDDEIVARSFSRLPKGREGAALGEEFKPSEAERVEKVAQEYIVNQMFREDLGKGSDPMSMGTSPKEYLGPGGFGRLQQKNPKIAQMIQDVSARAKEIYAKGRKTGMTAQRAVVEAYEEFWESLKATSPIPATGPEEGALPNDPLGIRK